MKNNLRIISKTYANIEFLRPKSLLNFKTIGIKLKEELRTQDTKYLFTLVGNMTWFKPSSKIFY